MDPCAAKTYNVLIIDDDQGTRDTCEGLLRLEGLQTKSAASGREGIELIQRFPFDLVIVDLRLADMSGLDVLRALRPLRSTRSVLVSAFLTVPTATEAMRCGAFDVVEKPLSVDSLLAVVRASQIDLEEAADAAMETVSFGAAAVAPRSAVERMVAYVLKVLDSHGDGEHGDFKTIDEWARRVGVSYSTLCETCRLLGIRPLDARDFARVLSALKASSVHACPPEVFLNVSSRRVLRAMSMKAGVDLETVAEHRPIHVFFTRQRFIAQGNRALQLIRAHWPNAVVASPSPSPSPAMAAPSNSESAAPTRLAIWSR